MYGGKEMRNCTNCGKQKEDSDFVHGKDPSKYTSNCKACKKSKVGKRDSQRAEEKDRKAKGLQPLQKKKKQHPTRNKTFQMMWGWMPCKECPWCGCICALQEFYESKSPQHVDGYSRYCIRCTAERWQIQYHEKGGKEYFEKRNKELRTYLNDMLIKWRKENPERSKELCRRGRQRYEDKQILNNPNFKLIKNGRHRIREALKEQGMSKNKKTIDLIGCTVDHLAEHLSFMFEPDMSWDNYGKVWQIDHIVPCSSFDLSDEDQQHACFYYSNLQPLFCDQNSKKKDEVVPLFCALNTVCRFADDLFSDDTSVDEIEM